MCGRYTITCPPEQIRVEFGVDAPAGYEPRYNVAPRQPVPVIGRDAGGARRAAMVLWGLVPHWSRSPTHVRRTINARAESLLERATFREPFLERRCLVLADGFYEWRRDPTGRQPFRFYLRSGRPFAFAGLWDRWREPDGGSLFSCAIVTTDASTVVAPVHERMPVILTPDEREVWLDPETPVERLQAMLRPYARGDLTANQVSRRVNSVDNDSPECIEPL